MATTPRVYIQLRMIVRMAISNLKFKRFRTIVTILGIVIGIGSIFLLMASIRLLSACSDIKATPAFRFTCTRT